MQHRKLNCHKMGNSMIVQLGDSMDPKGWKNRTVNELEDVCAEASWDDDIRVIVFTYPGRIFESANKQKVIGKEVHPASFVDPIAQLRKPIIAAIDGDAIGPALELALAGDIRIGTEGARFGLPQVCEGYIPCAGGTQRLPRLIGPGKAMEMILTGEPIDAQTALRIGLVHRIVPQEELVYQALELANDMAARSPLAMGYVKEALYSGLDLTVDQGMRMELDLYLLLFSTQDRTEGITAFKEKRKPEFKGV